MTIKGDESRLAHFEWNEEYDDWVNRFEAQVDITKIKGVQELYDALHDWLGVSKRGRMFPTQTQMDFFSEYYHLDNFPVSEYMSEYYEKQEGTAPQYHYRSGTFYNEETKEVSFRNRKTDKYEHYIGKETLINMRWSNKRGYSTYRKIVVIRDVRTNKILAWHKDITNEKYYGELKR